MKNHKRKRPDGFVFDSRAHLMEMMNLAKIHNLRKVCSSVSLVRVVPVGEACANSPASVMFNLA